MFCSNCGREVGNTERFCPYCGTPAGAPAGAPAPRMAPAAPRVSLSKRLSAGFKNVGVKPALYLCFIFSLILSWMFINTPIFALKTGLFEFDGRSLSVGFTQLAGGQFTDGEAMSIIDMIVSNLALIAGIVMAILPIFLNSKVSVITSVIGISAAGLSLLLVLIEWIVHAVTGYMFVWLSVSGFWYVLAIAGVITFGIMLLVDIGKRTPKAPRYNPTAGGYNEMYR